VPVYADSLHQMFGVENCLDFIRANDGSTMGRCADFTGNYVPQAAPPGQKLMPIMFVGDIGYSVVEARLGLGGGFAVFRTLYSDAEVTYHRIVTAHYDASANAWVQQDSLPITIGTSLTLLTPTAGPHPHIAYVDNDTGPYAFHELAYDGAAWAERPSYPLASLGIDSLQDSIAMTSDGLHVVASTNVGTVRMPMFTDRAAITDGFGPFRALATIPTEAADLFITDDCSQLYFSAIERMLYLEEN
jgi:hypothetical protein